jgi:predicted RNA-binding protein YlxR (DUF448 family)
MAALAQDEVLDAGPRRAGTERLCIATGETKPVDALIRFVLGPDGAVVPDLRRKLPGRGVWLTASRQALATAVARKAFARGFKRDVIVTPELAVTTDRLMVQGALDALAICRKGGRVAAGFTKCQLALARERVVALLHASDAAPDGTGKLDAALRSREDAARIAVISAFESSQLDLALARSNVIHAALLAAPESETFLARAAQLERFRTGPMPGPPAAGRGSRRRVEAGPPTVQHMTDRDWKPREREGNWDRNG